jgi:hypothetical protein
MWAPGRAWRGAEGSQWAPGEQQAKKVVKKAAAPLALEEWELQRVEFRQEQTALPREQMVFRQV